MFKTIIKKIFNRIVYTYNRVTVNLRNYKLRFLYNTKNKVTVYKDVHLDNPKIVFGNDVALLYGVHIFGDGEVNIGNNVCIGKDTIIWSALNGGVTIGNDTMIAGQCYIIDSDHGIDKDEIMRKQSLSTEKIVIGNDVWIAAGCKILKGINIGDGAVIGANAVVTKDILEPNTTWVGVPARKIGYRK